MALIEKLEKIVMERNSVHKPAGCSYSLFQDQVGKQYLQIDTFGSNTRKLTGKKSQTIQLNERSARELMEILRRNFD